MKVKFALISLEKSNRAEDFFLSNGFDKIDFSVIGVDGRLLSAKEYFELGVAGRSTPMTPAEVGCALSHLQTYKSFIDDSADLLVVFEDDARLKRKMPDFATLVSAFCDSPTLIILGGQDGLTTRKKIHGKQLSNFHNFWLIPPESYRCLWRTCGYAINRSAAIMLLGKQQSHLQNADMWHKFFLGESITVLYNDVVSHPVQTLDSQIEGERLLMKKIPQTKLLVTKIKGLLKMILAKIGGNIQIHKV